MGYRFHFYGRRPEDWIEGANMGHGYEVAFQQPPDKDQREALARLAEERFSTGPCELSSDPWLWSRHVASFSVGERWHNSTPMVFSRVTDFLVAAHQIAPIDQAIFYGVRAEGSGRWDRWTRESRPVPAPGPPYDPPRVRPFGRSVDPDLPVAAPDESFEAARAAARASIQERRAQEVTRRALGECTKSGLRLVAHDGPVPPVNPIEDPRFGAPPEGSEWVIFSGQPVYALIRDTESKKSTGLALLDEAGEARRVAGVDGHPIDVALSADGTRGITAYRADPPAWPPQILLIDTDTFSTRPLWNAEEVIRELARLVDGNWLVSTDKQLVVLDGKTDEAPEVISTLGYKSGVGIVVAHGGTCVVMSAWPHLDVFGYCLGKLKKLGRLKKVEVHPRAEVDDRFVGGIGGNAVTLSGFEQAYEAWAAPLRKKEEARRKRALGGGGAKATKLALEPIDEPLVHDDTLLGPYDLAQEQLAPQFAGLEQPEPYKSGPDGRVVVVDMGEVERMPKKGIAAWVGKDDELRTHQLEIFRSQVRFTPDQRLALVFNTSSMNVVFIDLETDEAEGLKMPGPLYSVDSFTPLDRDRVVGTHGKGLVLWQRTTAGWCDNHVKLAKCTFSVWCAALEVLVVLTNAPKARLVLYAVAGEQLVKLGAFAERVDRVGVAGEEVRVRTVDGPRFTLRNVKQVADKKRAQALAKKKKKAAKKKT